MDISMSAIGYAVLGGVAPALVWLFFLLREDARCPEPRTLIFLAFLGGMITVPLVLPLESLSYNYALAHFTECVADSTCLPIIVMWATIEEAMKYTVAAALILWRKDVDEPMDIVIYMITVALGFAALENTLFLLSRFADGQVFGAAGALALDNLRFIGSTLLHVVASSAVGFALAFSYRQVTTVGGYAIRASAAAFGLILAIALHTLFNFLIINQNGSDTIAAFFVVWTGAVVFFALFEVLKYYRYRNLPANTC
ncbi:MAG: PrsW family glutamic-type intramembrane protease [Candidatus Pacebacteria bacterium]|nr:PrsW family glutamic-type intramembrane protease [Candidatus Paceibacterota bacterium]